MYSGLPIRFAPWVIRPVTLILLWRFICRVKEGKTDVKKRERKKAVYLWIPGVTDAKHLSHRYLVSTVRKRLLLVVNLFLCVVSVRAIHLIRMGLWSRGAFNQCWCPRSSLSMLHRLSIPVPMWAAWRSQKGTDKTMKVGSDKCYRGSGAACIKPGHCCQGLMDALETWMRFDLTVFPTEADADVFFCSHANTFHTCSMSLLAGYGNVWFASTPSPALSVVTGAGAAVIGRRRAVRRTIRNWNVSV